MASTFAPTTLTDPSAPIPQPPTTPLPDPSTSPASTSTPTAQQMAKATYQQTKDLLRKTKERAKEMHDVTHETCHNRVAAMLAAAKIHTPTPDEVLRYRYHHGVNLGSCFVLERWLTPSMFPQGADTSELAAVTASCNQYGHVETRRKWEAHWADMISDADWDWLVNVAHCSSMRLPIGYWIMGATCTKGTPFQDFAPVYISAWSAVKKMVAKARARGIGVLVDLHALPGGANGGDHSGTNNGKADLWSNNANLDLAMHCILLLVQELNRMEGIIGLQLCNEALYNAPSLYEWYDHALSTIQLIDAKLPIYISDAWNLGTAVRYVQGKNTVPTGTGTVPSATNPVFIDTHFYWNFSEADKLKPPQQIIAEVPSRLNELDNKDGNVCENGAALAVVGEYSCAMDEKTWSQVSRGERPHITIDFGQAQSRRWQLRAGGAYFWTFKMDWMDGGEWGFVQQTNMSSVIPPSNLLLPTIDVQKSIGASQRPGVWNVKRNAAVKAHIAYWTSREPGKPFEHWRHETGWDVGFADAAAFFGMRASGGFDSVTGSGKRVNAGMGGDKIGCLDMWVRKRILDSGMVGPFVWEFETGLRQGVQAFYEIVGI